jgi:dienelactone hydrolase
MHSLTLLASSLLACLPQHGAVSFQPSAAETRVPVRFRLDAATFPFEREERKRTPHAIIELVRFPSPVVTPDPLNNTVHAEYFRPAGRTGCPAVVVLHILGSDFALSRYLAARLADRGIAALFVKLPYYGERRPAGDSKRFLSTDVERSISSMRQAVCDVRRAAVWLARQPEVNAQRIGVAGISLGGIVAALAVAVDPALNEGAFLLAGGGLADILWTMPEATRYRTLWMQSGRTKEDLEALTRPIDPLTYAGGLKGKRVLMIAGTSDEVVPPARAQALWEAAGRPTIKWYDCGHYSAVGYLLPGIRTTVDFFAAEPARRP